jgi:acyl carrier protein
MSLDSAQIQTRVHHYILENLMFTDDESQLPVDASLLEQGIIDSTGVLEVVMFLEESFGVAVDDTQMLPQNFDSVARITAFVQRLLAAK